MKRRFLAMMMAVVMCFSLVTVVAAYDLHAHIVNVEYKVTEIGDPDDMTVSLDVIFTRVDDPELPLDSAFYKENRSLSIVITDRFGHPVDFGRVYSGNSANFQIKGPGFFVASVNRDEVFTEQGDPFEFSVGVDDYKADHTRTEKWAEELLAKTQEYESIVPAGPEEWVTIGEGSNSTFYAPDRHFDFAVAALKEIAEELGTTDRLLFEVNVDEVLTIAKGLEGGDKSKLIHDISDDWYIADCAMKAYLADLAKYTFTDVPDDSWYAPYVKSAVRSGLVKGKAEGVFAPDASMTIAEAITLAARFEAALYEDIDPAEGKIGKRWYYPYIWYARERGIPCDYEDYNAKITREEFAHIFATLYKNHKNLYDEAGIVALNDVPDGFIPDVAKDDDFADDIYTLYRLGVLSGSDSKRSFLPDSNIKRSEVAAILCRLGGTGRVEF